MAEVSLGIDVFDVVGLIAVGFGLFVCCPIIIYCVHRTRSISDSGVFKHRQLSSIYTLNALIVCNIVFLGMFLFVFTIYSGNMNDNNEWMMSVANAVLTVPVLIVFALKSYLLYFEEKYQRAIMNMTWLKQLNCQVTDWYIATRHTFGNFCYLMLISSIAYPLMVLCCIFVHHILSIMFTYIPLLIAFLFYYSVSVVSGFHDLFGICNEIKYEMMLIFSMFTLYLSLFLMSHYLSMNAALIRIASILYIVFINLLLFALSILSTAYPIYLHIYGIKDPNDPTGNTRLTLNKTRLSTIYHRGHHKHIEKNKKISSSNIKHLLQCIANEKWLNLFMHHLVHEFSSENMLFLVELIQVKYAFHKDKNGVIKVPKSIYHLHEMSLTQSIKNSSSFKLGLNIGNYSFSQQSAPQQITTISPSSKTPNLDINKASVCSLSDDDINNNQFHLKLDANITNDNDLYHVIDFNAQRAHHQHSSSFLAIGNWSPSASYSSLILTDYTYPETDAKVIANANIQKQKHQKSKSHNDVKPTLKVPRATRIRSGSNHRKTASFSYLFSNDGKILHHIRLPQGLPHSKILINHKDLTHRMIALYRKYIGYGALHQLNLCSSLKNRMDMIFTSDIIQKADHESMYNILDEVAISVIHLMKDSFNRFKYIPKGMNQKKQTNLDMPPGKRPVLRNASSFSDVINTYGNNRKEQIKISV